MHPVARVRSAFEYIVLVLSIRSVLIVVPTIQLLVLILSMVKLLLYSVVAEVYKTFRLDHRIDRVGIYMVPHLADAAFEILAACRFEQLPLVFYVCCVNEREFLVDIL